MTTMNPDLTARQRLDMALYELATATWLFQVEEKLDVAELVAEHLSALRGLARRLAYEQSVNDYPSAGVDPMPPA